MCTVLWLSGGDHPCVVFILIIEFVVERETSVKPCELSEQPIQSVLISGSRLARRLKRLH